MIIILLPSERCCSCSSLRFSPQISSGGSSGFFHIRRVARPHPRAVNFNRCNGLIKQVHPITLWRRLISFKNYPNITKNPLKIYQEVPNITKIHQNPPKPFQHHKNSLKITRNPSRNPPKPPKIPQNHLNSPKFSKFTYIPALLRWRRTADAEEFCDRAEIEFPSGNCTAQNCDRIYPAIGDW